MAQHIVVNITWQENYWTGVPTKEDMQRAGHRFVSAGNVGHEYLNFELTQNVVDGYKIGFFQATRQPTRFSNGEGYIFFYSGGYIVGVYGRAEIGVFDVPQKPPDDPWVQGNIRAPVEQVCRFQDIRLLKLNPDRHLGGKKRIGMIGFTYIDDSTASNILHDAIKYHEEGSEYRAKLEALRARLDKTTGGRSIWKIAPGEQAELWDQCRERGCIVIGWDSIGDFSQYETEEAVKQALGISTEDHSRNALTIWRFTHEVDKGDIVIANKGRSTVVGIGVITSNYIPPGHPQNPNLRFSNARLVDWKITETVDIPASLPIPTLMPVTQDQWRQIKQAYVGKNPALATVFAHLEGTAAEVATDPVLEKTLKATRNIILYGPPGTGKTFRVHHFAAAWTQGQISEVDASRRNFWCVVANPNEWHWDVLFGEKGIQGFRMGRIKRNYLEIQPGDLVFGYLANPDKQIYCLAEVVQPPVGSDEDYGFYMKKVKKLASPIPWSRLRDDSILQNSEPVRFRMQGTLFRFEATEAAYLRELIEGDESEISTVFDNYWGLTGPGDYVRTVTFHQSYGYEDFVEGLRPLTDEQGQIRYEWRPGIFKQMCDDASADPDNDFILIVDEINRGNIAKIFGELITLLEDDKRLGQKNEMTVILPGSKQRFGVPDNLYLLGTMNTADRSIALLDIALRRRFTFVPLYPDATLLEDQEIEGISLSKLLTRLNVRIEALLGQDHTLGHSYFMGLKTLADLHFTWYNKVIPLLQEYFYNDGERLRAVLDDFVDQDEVVQQNIFTNPPDTFDPELVSYRVVQWSGTQFVAALKKIAGIVQ